MKRKKNLAEITFNIFNFLFMATAVIVCLYPLWYVLIASFSGASAVTTGKVMFWIKDFNVEAYKKAFEQPYMGVSYLNTIYYALVGTVLSMVLTVVGAYPLSKKRLNGRKFMTLFTTFTMWFSAGMLPNFIMFRTYGLLDTRLGVLLQGAVSTFYVIIMRTAFESVPDSLEESMKIDGASDFQILIHTYLPLTVPTLMTLTLYYFVMRWNSYFWPMILLSTETKVPLQVVLKKLVVDMSGLFENSKEIDISTMSKETIVYATMVLAVAPMLIIYPFIQKFFVKGIAVGAVKG